jgi:hypothetical protein
MGERRISFLETPLKSGDIVTIWGNRGRIGYRVNGEPNGYSFRLRGRRYYLTSSLLFSGDKVTLVGSQGFLKRNKQVNRLTNKLVKSRMGRKINVIMKSGKLGQPKVVRDVRKIFKRSGVKGKLGFWNRLFGAISSGRSIRRVMKVIALKRWIKRYRPSSRKVNKIAKANRLISINPWLGTLCNMQKSGRLTFRSLRRFLSRNRIWGTNFLRKIYRLIKRNSRCHSIVHLVIKRQVFIQQQRVNQIVKSNLLSNIVWQNGSRVYTHPRTAHMQMVSRERLPSKFAVNIRINNLHMYHITLGVKSNPFPRSYWWSYLGWYPGEWAIMDHPGIFAERSWRCHNAWWRWGNGAVLTIWGNNGMVGMRLNGNPNSYMYNMRTTNLWLGVTLYWAGDQVEIISGEGFDNK